MKRIILNEPFKECKKLEADIMLKDRFIATVVYNRNPIFPIDINTIEKLVIEKLPSLKGKSFEICFSD